ncbi:tRNA guanosine-2'-O-methyltransferase [Lactarius akahatsu]|uniref:tRNA guanosine-2'-O-methyltransferase n=1 Tax=Lactarius akahatsu TaxID=416441 RepID=A0AAD4Q998_9AGAM|nr:tRNA guanosine-2'-O-methyltransferase [Lactarius akahatsu]
MPPRQYLVVFAQTHEDFRVPELRSVAELYGFPLTIPHDFDKSRPFGVLALDQEEHARFLARRCILIKAVYEFYASGRSYEELHEQNRSSRNLWEKYIPETSFKFVVNGYNHSISKARQREVIEDFSYMGFMGKIDLVSPEITMGYFEEYRDRDIHGTTSQKHEGAAVFREAFFGRLLEQGSARSLIKMFDVKKRQYFGNTSMEAEISLLMANQTLASPGKLIYDPFIGTGSLAYTTAHFGAFVFGSDIDGRQMRGKETKPGILRAATQYGVRERILDLCTFDITRNPWRCGGLFDCDHHRSSVVPPIRLPHRNPARKRHHTGICDQLRHPFAREDQPYLPPTKPYELSALAADLVVLARYLLNPGGRLVFFLPTVIDEYKELDLDSMLCDGMEVVRELAAGFRCLITIRKSTSVAYPPPTFDPQVAHGGSGSSGIDHDGEDASPASPVHAHVPAHRDFREKYFQGFKPKKPSSEEFDT